MYIVTVTERTPTPKELKDINVYTHMCDSMLEVCEFLTDREIGFTCWVNVSITFVKDDL